MDHQLTTPPAETPITLVEAKAHLNITHDDDDALVSAAVESATGHLDGRTGILGRCLVTQSWTATLDHFGIGCLVLALAPVQSITAIKYRDVDGALQTFAAAAYRLTGSQARPRVVLNSGFSWPATDSDPEPITIEYVAGYGDAADVPDPIKHAIKLHVGTMFEYRETITTGSQIAILPHAHEALISPYRLVSP
jgi:uncharacterized phiE125 gp8 family phage protein